MPSRIIKESICSSDNLSRVPLELVGVWAHLLVSADDFGRMDAREEIIKGRCFPLRPKITNDCIKSWLKDLQQAELLVLYEVEGRPYYQLSKWDKHNRLRNKTSKYPDPPCLQMPATASTCKQMPTHTGIHQHMSSYTDSDSESDSETNNNIRSVVLSDQILKAQKFLSEQWPQALTAANALALALESDGESYVLAQIVYARQRARDNPGKYLVDSLSADFAGYRGQAKVRAQAAEDRHRREAMERQRREVEDEDALQWQASQEGQTKRALLQEAGYIL